MKKKNITRIVSTALAAVLLVGETQAVTVNAQGAITAEIPEDYWNSREILQIYYEGMIRFKPSYCTTASDKENYGLKKNKHVKQAYINYTRDGESVCGGRQRTKEASKKTDSNYYRASASAWDTLNPVAAKTKFHYHWKYF